MLMHRLKCNKFKTFMILKVLIFYYSSFSIICSRYGDDNDRIFKEGSIEILKICGLIK